MNSTPYECFEDGSDSDETHLIRQFEMVSVDQPTRPRIASTRYDAFQETENWYRQITREISRDRILTYLHEKHNYMLETLRTMRDDQILAILACAAPTEQDFLSLQLGFQDYQSNNLVETSKSTREPTAEELINDLQTLVSLITNQQQFLKKYGFTLQEYLENRVNFALKIKSTAESIQRVTKKTGIARTVAGGTGALSSGMVIAGLVLMPVTAGLSSVLTIGGIAGSAASAVTVGGSAIIKDQRIKSDGRAIKEYMESFEEQEKVTTELFKRYVDTVEQLKMRGELSKMKHTLGAWSIGSGIYNMTRVLDGAAPGLQLLGQTLVTAGSTTAKVFSGALAGVGVVFGAWDIIEGLKSVKNPSEVSEGLLKFAEEYAKDTDNLDAFIQNLSVMFVEN